ncbi:MAG: sn-glycerol-3-phosphate ABC transporter ATP-binding protein UgpC [Agathobaculum sp.]|uniref:ABC transporter ATP-binding protein n=1 Tax=Agathobaculum sp. TaxID=2048138 RepID=UPI002A81A947|nr:sn-glycerol-3-phosphate ABC transporter ATP-binding protein UgpC [Agathobaculum sp.]MDY3712668.1 sn-glycerol-3-phosphate ABC transporter ATP-binding protein UgpC [Agathobaculum sp.]
MATVVLNKIKKIYPNTAKKHKKKEAEKKTNLQVTDEGVLAVQEFNLEIADKEFIVLVGPSGCGKSTTLRMVAGLEEISGGDLYIDGKRMNDVDPKDRDIAMVFQNYALYPHMTVFENMAFSLKLKKVSKDIIEQKVREAAEILDITQYLDRKPKALSGGQRQRVAIGRAIVRNPKVFLMDEPLSNLDAKLRNQMRAEILKLRQRIDTTFIYVTHDQTEAMTLGDRIVIMKDGVIQQVGTPQEVFDHPANLFVAGFIGMPQMNFFEAELQLSEDGYAVALGGVAIPISAEKQARLRQNGIKAQPVTLGIRPEHISLTGDSTRMLRGTVDVSEMMGSAIHLHVNVLGRDAIIIVPTTELDANGHKTVNTIGHAIAFTFSGNLVHLFDRESGSNLEA